MVDPKRIGVKNPLTIVAIFAGLAEVSGTAVLPLLEKDIQTTFVWFLMLFPVLLVLLFFGTLVFRHHVLYAPSDFRDETLFASLFERGTSAFRIEGIETEISELNLSKGSSVFESAEVKIEEVENLKTDPLASYLLFEELAITHLTEKYKVSFERDVRLKENPNVHFDAVYIGKFALYIVEILYLNQITLNNHTVRRKFKMAESVFKRLPEEERKHFKFIICIVFDSPEIDGTVSQWNQINQTSSDYQFVTEIEILTSRELYQLRASDTASSQLPQRRKK